MYPLCLGGKQKPRNLLVHSCRKSATCVCMYPFFLVFSQKFVLFHHHDYECDIRWVDYKSISHGNFFLNRLFIRNARYSKRFQFTDGQSRISMVFVLLLPERIFFRHAELFRWTTEAHLLVLFVFGWILVHVTFRVPFRLHVSYRKWRSHDHNG